MSWCRARGGRRASRRESSLTTAAWYTARQTEEKQTRGWGDTACVMFCIVRINVVDESMLPCEAG